MEDDPELKLINARKMAELRRKAVQADMQHQQDERKKKADAQRKPAKSSKELVLERLYDRGDEVLETAYQYYPRETSMIVEQLVRVLRQAGNKTERISGGELYSLFRNLGLRFSLKTSIKVQDKGRLVDLQEKLRANNSRGKEENAAIL